MDTSLYSRKRVVQVSFTRRFLILTGMLLLTLTGKGFAQSKEFYETDNYNPLLESKSGTLGTLFNAQPHLLLSIPTDLHGPQDVWTTAYLPFVDQEFDPAIPLTLFGPHYTTGIALASPRDPALELYAPIQVRSIKASDNDPNTTDQSALARSYPPGQSPSTAGGPFNMMLQLNNQLPSFAGQKVSYDALTALAYAQQFARFSHSVLKDQNGVGWNGGDKSGNTPVRFSIVEGDIPYIKQAQFTRRQDGTADIVIPTSYYNSGLPRATIGHEIGHLITYNVNGPEKFNQFSQSLIEINEGFSSLLGHSFRLWMRPEQFTQMDWEYFREYTFPGEKVHQLNDPKANGLPSTYLGEFFQTNTAAPGYDSHTNGSVLGKWLSLVVEGGKGYVDDKVEKGAYWVKPLVPADLSASYTLALRIIFRAFTKPMDPATDYPLLRSYVLEATIEMGFPPGTHVYDQVKKAWAAVGVGQTGNVVTCDQTHAESLLNGTVEFPVTTSIGEDPTEFAHTLSDCSQSDALAIYTEQGLPLTDWDGDKVYSETNDDFTSKLGVSIYKFSMLSRDFFKENFGHGGYQLKYNLTESDAQAITMLYKGNQVDIWVPGNPKYGIGDVISRLYFRIAGHYLKPTSPDQFEGFDHSIISRAMANIYALEIRRKFETLQGNSDAHNLWAVSDEESNLNTIHYFADPKLYGQPALYKGDKWKADDLVRNTGFLNLFYYLLAHGTADELGQDFGYANTEIPGKIYFVNPIDRRLVWKVLWNAYISAPSTASIEEFRQATMTALYELDPDNYGPKSKEHIAFYDAWAAVLGLPDYASTLAHFPEDESVQYPWSAKVGVEVEYPLYESYRLFEVSKSQTFNEAEYPVHRFVNNTAPDQANSMSFGEVNLEPGERYYVRSRLAEGEGSRQFCANTDDPGFCESLLNKKKWTLTYPFITDAVPAPEKSIPLNGEQVKAWGNTFTWSPVVGSLGYNLHVTDQSGQVAPQSIPVDFPYDQDNENGVVTHDLVLSGGKDYKYNIAARQKLGSDWAVHILPGGMLKSFTEQEKALFSDILGKWTAEKEIQTDVPAMVLESPEDGAKVPLFGSPIELKAKESDNKRADYYMLDIGFPGQSKELAQPELTLLGTDLKEVKDQKVYQWRMIAYKKATAPFIPDDESGAVPEWYHFKLDAGLVPAPVIIQPFTCIGVGKKVVVSWEAVPGAKGYEYAIIDLETGQDVARDIVTGLTESPAISGATIYPKSYKKVVRAGIQDPNGNWIWGKSSEAIYKIRPEPPTDLTPSGQDVPLGPNNSIHFTWQDPLFTGAYNFRLTQSIPNANSTETIVNTEFSGTDILVEDLEFDTEYQVTVNVKSNNDCSSAGLSHIFRTVPETITFDPELNFKFLMSVTDILGWGIPDPSVQYNLTVSDPNGNTILNKPALNSGLSQIDEQLPAISGIYTVTALVLKADPVYLKTEAEEGGVLSQVQLINKAAGQNTLLDSELLGAHFDPVQSLIIQLKFEVDLDNELINQRKNAADGDKNSSSLVKVHSVELEYPNLEMTLFPNPASNEVQIMPGLVATGKDWPLQVIDQQGRIVLAKNWQGEKVDISQLAEGTYIVKISRGQLVATQKLIIRK